MSTASIVNECVFGRCYDQPWLSSIFKSGALLIAISFMLLSVNAQSFYTPTAGDNPYVVEGVSETVAYSVGHSIRINGTARKGAVAVGGDVIVQGTVDDDVAAIGGSVIQLEGARINGDVMVVGGDYRHADKKPLASRG